MKTIIIGRPHIPATKELKCSTKVSLDSDDIYKYVVDKVSEPPIDQNLLPSDRAHLVTGANRMFLWVSLIVDNLSKIKHSTPNEIHQKLKKLPTDIMHCTLVSSAASKHEWSFNGLSMQHGS